MSLARAGIWSAIGTGARLAAGLVVIKLVAGFAGPEGVGKLGQFMSLMSLLAVLAGGGISAGIVKYVAEYREDPLRLRRLLSAALSYALCASCLMGLAALLFSRQLAGWIFADTAYVGLIRILALAQLGIAAVNYVLAVINGFMDVRRLAFVQVVGSALGMAMALCLASQFRLYGALLALVVGQLAWLAVAIPTWWQSPYFRLSCPRLRFDREMNGRLAAFSLMTISSALLPPLVNIAVRDHLALHFGWEQVGNWQAVSRVSDAYLLFLTTAINIYYLPKLASLRDRGSLVSELRAAYSQVLPAVLVLAAAVFALRGWVTRFLFSADFTSADALYAPQLVGDVVKIASFLLSYVMLAKAMTGLFIASEIVFGATYLLLVYACTAHFGLVGAMYAFAINYVGYLVFNIVVVRRYVGGLVS